MASAEMDAQPENQFCGMAGLAHALQRVRGSFAPTVEHSESGFDGKQDAGSHFQRPGIYVFLISSACLYYLLNASILIGHYDLGWHLASGDLIRERGYVPFHDPWSFTAGGRQWFNLEWLWEVLASILFQYMHFTGVALSVVACGALIVGYLTYICLDSGAGALSVCISVLSACLLYPEFAAYPNIYLAAAPNIITMLFSVIFYGECLQRPTRVLVLPAMMLLWANLHGGFLLGLFIIGLFGGVALLKRDWASFRLYSLAGAACFAVTFVNPLGWHIYAGLTTVMGHFSQQQSPSGGPFIAI